MSRHATDHPNANPVRTNARCFVTEEIYYFVAIPIEKHKHVTSKTAQEVHLNFWAAIAPNVTRPQ